MMLRESKNHYLSMVIMYCFNYYLVMHSKSFFRDTSGDRNTSLYSVLYFSLLGLGQYFWLGLQLGSTLLRLGLLLKLCW